MTHEENPECKTHPCAPHGFDRSSSHSLDRYVCECEWWEPSADCAALELQATIAAQAAEIERLLSCLEDTPADPWQPIETAPKDERVLVWRGDSKNAEITGSWDWYEYIGNEYLAYTHWMPLPTPPTQEKADE